MLSLFVKCWPSEAWQETLPPSLLSLSKHAKQPLYHLTHSSALSDETIGILYVLSTLPLPPTLWSFSKTPFFLVYIHSKFFSALYEAVVSYLTFCTCLFLLMPRQGSSSPWGGALSPCVLTAQFLSSLIKGWMLISFINSAASLWRTRKSQLPI